MNERLQKLKDTVKNKKKINKDEEERNYWNMRKHTDRIGCKFGK